MHNFSMAAKRKAAAAFLLVALSNSGGYRKPRKKRKIWIREWLKAREERSIYYNLLGELRQDPFEFNKYLRMDPEIFEVGIFYPLMSYLIGQTFSRAKLSVGHNLSA